MSSLYIGVTFSNFQSLGKIPVLIERLNRLVRDGAIIVSASFNSLAEMPSRPRALFLGRALNKLRTSLIDVSFVLKEC